MKIDTAMVLAAGLGTRFRDVSGELPKPLVEVAGKPLIDWALDGLADAGVARAVLNVHYKADVVEGHVNERASPQISISDERDQLMETGGGLMQASPKLGEGPLLCTNTDAIFDPHGPNPASLLAAAWQDEEMDALLLLVPIELTSGYAGQGDFALSAEGRLSDANDVEAYVFTGLQVIHPRLWANEMPTPQSTRIFWDRARANDRAFGIVYESRWMHVGDPDGYDAAEAYLKEHG